MIDVDAAPDSLSGSGQIRENAPFNYIAFSQRLYGEQTPETQKSRAVSFV
jgi:hypothetical protein